MEYRTLGRTGIQVSHLTLGAMSFGALGNTDHDDCARIIRRALDAGVNIVDTADVYSNGESEIIVGQALRGRRDDVVLVSKCFWPMGADPNRRGSSRRWIVRACEESLARLGTDHLDVYFLHKPDLRTDIAESLGAMTDLVHAGKVRMVAVSTFPADLLVEAQWAAQRDGLVPPRVEQPPYSIFTRGIERDVLPACERYGMGVLVWGPLNSGWLTGKYRGAIPAGSRAERWRARSGRGFDDSRAPVSRKHELVDALAALAADAGCSLAHLAIAFSHAHPAVTSTIIGPRTMEQLDDLLAGADTRLDHAMLDAIDSLVAPGPNVDDEADSGWIPPWITDAAARRR
ncbi:MAG TPA: aldo/keto reductase [Acidimicrobiales bacterium]|nr:aldo/keto reductase [Acidimicrobiales bacterium]